MKEQSRRIFAKQAGIAAAGSLLNLNPRAIGANDKVVLALIGGRNQGRGDALRAIPFYLGTGTGTSIGQKISMNMLGLYVACKEILQPFFLISLKHSTRVKLTQTLWINFGETPPDDDFSRRFLMIIYVP